MTGYTLVLVIWLLALVLGLGGTGWQYRRWARLGAWRTARRAVDPPDTVLDAVADGWVRDAAFHLGLRVLLLVLALERLTLQLIIPDAEQGVFAASPLQLGLALIYLSMWLWISRWTYLTHQAQRARRDLGPDRGPS